MLSLFSEASGALQSPGSAWSASPVTCTPPSTTRPLSSHASVHAFTWPHHAQCVQKDLVDKRGPNGSAAASSLVATPGLALTL